MASSFSSDLEYLTEVSSLLPARVFTSAILTAVYIHPNIDFKLALSEPCSATNSLETNNLEPLVVEAGYFNQANIKILLSFGPPAARTPLTTVTHP